MQECPIGLDCSMMAENQSRSCASFERCQDFAAPWKLPYEYKPGNILTVKIINYWPEQQLEELKENGWHEAAKLPYHYDDGLIVDFNNRELGFETADEIPYEFNDGVMMVTREHYQLFAPANPLPYEIKKDGLYVVNNYRLDRFEYIWMKPEKLQYTYKFSKEYQCNLLRVTRSKNGFARAWYLKDRDRYFYKRFPILTRHYPRPDNWKFKKELPELGLKLAENQKPVAYYIVYSHRVRLWAMEDCDRIE
jgi:hypothetical protein